MGSPPPGMAHKLGLNFISQFFLAPVHRRFSFSFRPRLRSVRAVNIFPAVFISRGVARIFQRGGHRGRALKLICWERVRSCDAAGVTPLGGSGGMLPQEISKNGSS